MKVLVANDIDLFERSDPRAWAQRVFWFAEEGDLVIVSDTPDQAFLDHVGRVKAMDLTTVKVLISPEGRFGRRQIDPLALLDSEFLRSVADQVDSEAEVFALFPSAQLSEFGSELGNVRRLPGAAYFEQGGSALANSKAVFRAVAAGAGVATAPGAVCRSAAEAAHAMQRLINQGHDVMVKKAQHGGAAGNDMVLRAGSRLPTNIGGRHIHHLDGPDAVSRYWAERWDWASAGGTYPAVVERLLEVSVSCYAEYKVNDNGVELGGTGRLTYVDRMLLSDTLTTAPTTTESDDELVAGAGTLARVYQALGYRGHLCADAVVTVAGEVVFTEVNARTTTSTHLYGVVRDRLVGSLAPSRTIQQVAASENWKPVTTDRFLAVVEAAGLGYDHRERRGVLMTMPVPAGDGNGGFLYVLVCHDKADEEVFSAELDKLFAS